ncbi:MAG: hypothetical protein CMN71_13815 [Sphingomonadaceae bacterium]|nr:hypothetical protein [Sphingomonadaceae bacterium]
MADMEKEWADAGNKRRRPRYARQGRAGVIAVESACNRLDLIWRNLLEEDVGVDGTIEVALGDFPTGKLVGAQIKSGMSYIRSESSDGFRFYPKSGDLAYWQALSIPLFLFVHHPEHDEVYWVDMEKHFESRGDDPLGPAYVQFSKSNKIDEAFQAHLRARFDLTVYDDTQYAELRSELEAIVHTDGSGHGLVSVTALDLFVEGLWGLCSKLQFHSSLLADIIRKIVRDREGPVHVTYTFDRASLYPFLTRYFDVLARHHLALIDSADVNHSLYAKLEYPAFIAVLTTNGRRFVEYLRSAGRPGAHDNQFLSLNVRPHIQMEVYSSFRMEGDEPKFGKATDVLAIAFNPYLDYYRLHHWRRATSEVEMTEWTLQTITYHELREYIAAQFDDVDKDNIVTRYLDIPLSPLVCWFEAWNPMEEGFPTEALRGKSVEETAGFYDEMQAIMPGSVTTREPPSLPFPIPILASGEKLANALPAHR